MSIAQFLFFIIAQNHCQVLAEKNGAVDYPTYKRCVNDVEFCMRSTGWPLGCVK